MAVLRYADQETRNIRAAEARARQQAALLASTAQRQAEATADANYQSAADGLSQIASLTPADGDFVQFVTDEWVNKTAADVKTALALVKADVGLGNVDNTSDADKPVSTATQTALDGKMATWVSAPATASSTGTAGQLAYDGSYIYVCTASDTWVRAGLSTW